MKIENRDQALELLKSIYPLHGDVVRAIDRWDCADKAKKRDAKVLEILDALFPKPESERLKQLRADRVGLNLYPRHSPEDEDFFLRLVELLDAAIKEEEAKQ